VLDEMNTYDDSDGLACVFVFLYGGRGEAVVEKKREKNDNVQ